MEEHLHITSKQIHEQWQLTGSETSSICLKKKLALATYGQVAATFKHGINPKISAGRIFQLLQETEAIFQLAARTRSNLSTCSKDQKLFQHRRNSALESLEPNFESLGRTHSLHNTLINSSYTCCLYRSQSENHQKSSLLT